MELIQEIGSYAGFAAVLGLAVLSALYFSQARDVKRLREWAGRAPERAAEAEAGGRVAAQPAQLARPVAQPGTGTVGTAQPVAKPAPAPAPQPAAAATSNSGPEKEEAGEGKAEPVAAPAAATAAGAAAAGAGGATAAASAAGAAPATTSDRPAGTGADNGEGAPPSTARPDTQTGAKVLPAQRAVPPVRRPPAPRPGQTSVLASPPGSRPPARRESRWPAPRYIALIVAGVVILGLGGVVGVMQLTKEEDQKSESRPPATDVPDPTRSPDEPAPARVDPSTVTVAVLNATNTSGLAARVGSRLETAGFVLGNVTNAATRQRAESVAMFKRGANDEARAVARKLGITQIAPIDAQSQPLAGNASVVVLVGADKAQQ